MNVNEYILSAFSTIFGKSTFTKITSGSLVIQGIDSGLVEITPQAITLAHKVDLLSKIKSTNTKTNIIDSEKMTGFLQALESRFVRLNHVGISYCCKSEKKEIEEYKQALKNTGIKIYEELAENKGERWLFAGDISRWEAPLCEIVLNSASYAWYKDWLPAFQVDIDTTLTIEELEKLSQEYFGEGFWKWKLHIPNYGVVLAMAILGEINGIKITFGVGTNLRNTKYHRETIKELE